MLSKFTLANFKSYEKATLVLSPLTLLIGANASGKSNALEALQMLSWLAKGRRLEEIFRAVQDSETGVRGTLADLAHAGSDTFRFECDLESAGAWNHLEIELRVGDDGIRISKEEARGESDALPLYRVENSTTAYTHDLTVSYNNFARGGKKPQIACTDQQAVFTQLLTPARFGENHERSQKEIPKAAREFIATLGQILFLDPMPRRMRGYSFIVDKVLKGDGSNLSSVLYDLCETHGQKDLVLKFIQDLPEQNITEIDFLRGPRNEVMVKLKETFGMGEQFREAAVLSDGTLRVLAVAAALLSANPGSTVVIEEIDNGVHPSRAKGLLENIRNVARERKLSVLLTSHNPALQDALPPAALQDVVFCYRDPTRGDSRLVRLSDLDDYPHLVGQGPLGRLVTRGVLDRFVKSRKSPEEREKAALDWIEDLSRPVSTS